MKPLIVRQGKAILAAGVLALILGASPAKALTLQEAFTLALKQSEELRVQEEEIRLSRYRFHQAFGAIYPRISFKATEFIQDTEGTETSDSGVGSTLTRRRRPESKFVIEQPLFSGFRESSAARSFQAEGRREELTLQRATQLLFEDVASSFYLILRLERDRENVRTLMDLTQDRLQELRRRVNLGKSRRSEVLSVESQQEALAAQEALILGDIAIAREGLSYLTGLDASVMPLRDELTEIAAVEPEEELLSKAAQRTDIRALEQDVLFRRYRLKVARGGYFPTIDLLGNYYTKRIGFQEEIDWDLLFTLEFPLFQGGTQRAQVRQTVSELHQAEWNLARSRRDVRSEIKNAAIALRTSVAQRWASGKALEKAKESYQLQVQEYRLGLVNNLEVLAAMNAMQQERRNLDRAEMESKLNFLRLKVATEGMPLD